MTSEGENYSDLYHKVMKNKEKFETMLNSLYKNNDECLQMIIAQMALTFATYNNTGYFYSKILENFYVKLAEKYTVSLNNINCEKNSFLHVATMCLSVGGHSRVIERWIENCAVDGKHSVVLINQGEMPIPKKLLQNVEKKKGTIILLDNLAENQIKKALELRMIGMRYEYIILHIHMDDPVATIAFGNRDFTRPVIFFNHARHLFWIGKRVSDVIANFMTDNDVSVERKLLKNIYKLPIPIDSDINFTGEKDAARKKLNIQSDKNIIITIGSPYKFHPICNDWGFFRILDEILTDSNVVLYVMGPDGREKIWGDLLKKYPDRFVFLGNVAYEEGYNYFLIASDILIDSYPIGGGTVCVDSIKNSRPFVSLKNLLRNVDFVSDSEGFCENGSQLVSKIKKMLRNSKYRDFIFENERNLFVRDYSIDGWNRYLKEILDHVKSHNIRNLDGEVEPVNIDEYCVILNEIYGGKECNFLYVDDIGICTKKTGFPFLLEKRKYITSTGKLNVLRFMGINFKYKFRKMSLQMG